MVISVSIEALATALILTDGMLRFRPWVKAGNASAIDAASIMKRLEFKPKSQIRFRRCAA